MARGDQLNPDNAWAHYDLGLAFRAQGKLDEAIAAYREAIRLQPNSAQWVAEAARMCYDTKHFSTPPLTSGPPPWKSTRSSATTARPGIATTHRAPPRWPPAGMGGTTPLPMTRRRRNFASKPARLADRTEFGCTGRNAIRIPEILCPSQDIFDIADGLELLRILAQCVEAANGFLL